MPHYMPDRPTSSQREELAKKDKRPPDTTVLTTPTSAANGGYAYHDLNEDKEPRCNAGGPNAEFVEVTVQEARQQNKSPCGFCDRLRSQNQEC